MVLFATSGSVTAKSHVSDANILDGVVSKWQQWENTVNTLEYQGYKVQLDLRSPENVYTREQFLSFITEELVPEVKRSGQNLKERSLDQLLPPIFHQRFDKEFPGKAIGCLKPYTLVDDRGKLRLDEILQGKIRTIIRDDMKDIRYSAGSHQADVYASYTNYKVEDRNYFLFQLPLVVDGKFDSAHLDNNSLQIEAEFSSSEVDAETGFVTRHSLHRPDGTFFSDRFQYLPFFPDSHGIPLPGILVTTRFFKETNALKLIEIYVCTSASINREIPLSRFILEVPAGTTIVDRSTLDRERTQRDKTDRYAVSVTKQPVKDVNEYVEDASAMFAESVPTESAGSLWGSNVFICLNAAAVIVIVIFIMKKRATTEGEA